MTIIMINIKSFWEDIFVGFQSTAFENKLTFVKNAVMHTTTLKHCKARQVLRDLFLI